MDRFHSVEQYADEVGGPRSRIIDLRFARVSDTVASSDAARMRARGASRHGPKGASAEQRLKLLAIGANLKARRYLGGRIVAPEAVPFGWRPVTNYGSLGSLTRIAGPG